MSYSNMQVREFVAEALAKDAARLYDEGMFKWEGTTSDEPKRPLAEAVADYFVQLGGLGRLEAIKPICRVEGYCIKRDAVISENTNQWEKNLAMILWRLCNPGAFQLAHLGKVLQYEVPLKTSGQAAGAVDLIAWDGAALSLIELKYDNQSDGLLRCALEIDMYARRLSVPHLLADLKRHWPAQFESVEDLKIRKVVLLDEGSRQLQDLDTLKRYRELTGHSHALRLLDELGVEVCRYQPTIPVFQEALGEATLATR